MGSQPVKKETNLGGAIALGATGAAVGGMLGAVVGDKAQLLVKAFPRRDRSEAYTPHDITLPMALIASPLWQAQGRS